MSSADLTGTNALVTGATSGIGRATAVLLARRGAHVLLSGRDPACGDVAVAAICGRREGRLHLPDLAPAT